MLAAVLIVEPVHIYGSVLLFHIQKLMIFIKIGNLHAFKLHEPGRAVCALCIKAVYTDVAKPLPLSLLIHDGAYGAYHIVFSIHLPEIHHLVP